MIVWILIFLLVLILFPYAWGMLHCARMLRRLKRVGAQNGYRFQRIAGPIWSLKKFTARYDFSLSDQTTVYPVQLLISYHRGRTLVVRGDGRIREERRQKIPMECGRKRSDETRGIGRWKAVPKTVMPSIKTEGKRVIPILLNYPAYEKVVCLRKEGTAVLSNGDMLFEKRFYRPSAFERLLHKQEET